MNQPSAPQVRAIVAGAARTITPTWPLTSFIAVNPASGHLRRSMRELAQVPGETPTRAEHEYLRACRAGQIDLGALRTALLEVVPEFGGAVGSGIGGQGPGGAGVDVAGGGRPVGAVDIAVAALLTPPTGRGTARAEGAGYGGGVGAYGGVVDDALAPVDQYLSHVLARFSADPVWAPPLGEGLYDRFRGLAVHDRSLPRRTRAMLRELPNTAEAAIATVLATHGIGAAERSAAVAAQLAALPGWVSHLAWRAEHEGDVTLTDFVACRLALAHAAGVAVMTSGAGVSVSTGSTAVDDAWVTRTIRHATKDPAHEATPAEHETVARLLAALDAHTRAMIWQTAAETTYRDELIAALEHTDAGPTAEQVLDVQMVFCIDTRSEGLRRQLERHVGVQTYGLAGFFGVPLRYTGLFGQHPREQYPALLRSGYAVTERANDTTEADRVRRQRTLLGALRAATEQVASTPASAFAWAEVFGWGALLADVGRAVRRASRPNRGAGPADGGGAVPAVTLDLRGMPLDDRVVAAEAALRMAGLTRFSPLVVLTGHRTTTVNNLYRAALDCGACGGNPGGANARAAAAICNDPAVRERLAGRGIVVPDTTWFVAIEHETTTDRVTVLDPHLIPASHQELVDQLLAAAAAAGDALTAERRRQLPGADDHTPLRRIRGRATDAAEMYPELGLAGNAAIVIAPRSITRGVDLQRRTFLHDYDPAADPDGSALTNIMTAPLIVAQWINAQYYFSTVNPERHGAGNKTLHNPIGDLGVLAGHTGDLRTGLPWQSVAVGDELLHEPLRLSVLIQAPLDRIAQIVASTDALRALIAGGWISLHARAETHQPWLRVGADGATTDSPTTERNPS